MSTFVPIEDVSPEDVHRAYLELKARRLALEKLDAELEPDVDLGSLFLDRGELDRLPAPDPLIPGVLPRHAYGVLRGRDQSFKSFVALDWSLALATGQMWNLTPTQRVPVLYVAGEGAWGLRGRVTAWEERRQAVIEPGWFTVRQAALNMHRPGPAFDHLLEHIRKRGYGLVVVDTLRRVSGAADGNGSEMGAVVDSLDQIKQATADGSVLVVAHTDKGDNDSRGYSGIEDDADFVWHARREGNRLELELTKMKDGPDGVVLHMQAWPAADSMVLVPALQPAPGSEATESEAKLLATLQVTFPNGSYSGALRDASGLPKATFYRALAALQKRSEVINSGSHRRPFYEPVGLGRPAVVSPPDSPPDLHESHEVSLESHEVSLVSRPLGSETHETKTVEPAALSDEQRAILDRMQEPGA